MTPSSLWNNPGNPSLYCAGLSLRNPLRFSRRAKSSLKVAVVRGAWRFSAVPEMVFTRPRGLKGTTEGLGLAREYEHQDGRADPYKLGQRWCAFHDGVPSVCWFGFTSLKRGFGKPTCQFCHSSQDIVAQASRIGSVQAFISRHVLMWSLLR
ncbi:unnamed protein product [Allacma fusca]|uniref:Uncharacterized protein n=1 Tax=Allacma fusca TaxID=39272 RepID=A0A8J2JFT8_9HEXA|nr:unnamed protein product [Allacma fusca]